MDRLRIQVLQHEPFEGPGVIHEWAEERGHQILITEVFRSEPLPDINTFNWLVIMGGGMSVNDENVFPWLKPEKEFVKKAIDAGKVVIGICLGSQMIANVLGERVYKNKEKEIGWFPIQLTDSGKRSDFLTPQWNNQLFFHWHGETFDIPKNAVHLAESAVCRNQAFRVGNKVFGIQFHPETNLQTLNQMVSSGGAELIPAKYVMGSKDILDRSEIISTTRKLFYELLDKISVVNKEINDI